MAPGASFHNQKRRDPAGPLIPRRGDHEHQEVQQEEEGQEGDEGEAPADPQWWWRRRRSASPRCRAGQALTHAAKAGAGRRSPPSPLSALLALLFLASSQANAEAVPTLAECKRRVAAAPDQEESSACFYKAARDRTQRDRAVLQVESLLEHHPRHPWLSFYLGSLLWNDSKRATELFQTAAGFLAERKIPLGEVRARSNLAVLLLRQDRDEESWTQVKRAAQVAEATGDPVTLARARILEATYLSDRNQDLRHADRLLVAAEEAVFPDGPYEMRRDRLHYGANVALSLGRIAEGKKLLRRLVALSVQEGDRYGEATARYNLLRAVREEMALLPRPEGRQESISLARESLRASQAAGQRSTEAFAHGVLGLLIPGPEALSHFDLCFAAAGEVKKEKSSCRSRQARRLSAEDPARALRTVDEALALALEAKDDRTIASAWRERMRVSWRRDLPDDAVKDSLAALDAIEVLRDLQTGTEGRAELFSAWVGDYHWLVGRLLQEHARRGARYLDLAFQVQERMRARALIDALEAVRAAPSPSKETRELQARRAAVLAEIAQTQRRLLDRQVEGDTRSGIIAELRRRESEEEDLRDRIAKDDPSFSTSFATLEQMRGALAEDEALLSFQIAPWEDMVGDFMGGAWLIVASRDDVSVHPLRGALANRTQLRPAVGSFSGMIENGGDNPAGAAALYKALLAEGLAGLDPRVSRLVVVPDDALHRLPFAALRSAPGAAPLASRYEVTLIPSATLWLDWRKGGTSGPGVPALVLADPVSPATVNEEATERAAALLVAPRLGALPWARHEGKSVVHSLGGGSELRVGADASESFLKENGTARFGIVHFATHALTDDVEPDRSFILLSPGDSKEDGLLQSREIAGLDLKGRTVVLSSCSSASGEILRGEGVMGLARAFFQAGAHTVVASLWPLRDDHGAALFDRFYRHLAEGESVAAALQAAQRDRLKEGAPPVAWAGVVVLGDGGRVPLPGGRRGFPSASGWIIALLAALLVGVLILNVRARQRRTHI